jgi:hypothetical protein
MAITLEGRKLERMVHWKSSELEEALEDLDFLDETYFYQKADNNGEPIYLIQILDKSCSMTTITCHKHGYNFHWGNSTPGFIRAKIEEVMDS